MKPQDFCAIAGLATGEDVQDFKCARELEGIFSLDEQLQGGIPKSGAGGPW